MSKSEDKEKLDSLYEKISDTKDDVLAGIIDFFRSLILKMDPLDAMVNLGLGYHSYNVWKQVKGEAGFVDFIYGPVALKLAVSNPGDSNTKILFGALEVPINAQTVGLGMLAFLGIVPLVDALGKAAKVWHDQIVKNISDIGSGLPEGIPEPMSIITPNLVGHWIYICPIDQEHIHGNTIQEAIDNYALHFQAVHPEYGV